MPEKISSDALHKEVVIMDYNTQRKAVSAIDSFGRRHKLLLPLCLAAKLFTIIFCAIVRFFDMALSDDKGRFLGMDKKPRRDDIPEDAGEKKHIQLRHCPFIWRALSFTLALAFMFKDRTGRHGDTVVCGGRDNDHRRW